MPHEEELLKRIEELEKQVEELRNGGRDIGAEQGSAVLSRRQFLKTIGAGAAGIGALAMLPGAAANVKITDTGVYKDGYSFWNSGDFQDTDFLKVDGSNMMIGDLDTNSNDIVDGGTTVWDSANSLVPAVNIQTTGLDSETVGGHKITVGSSAPGSPSTNDIWIDTS